VFQPPHLGVGLVYSSFLEDAIGRDPGMVDFVEIEPETLWIQSAPGRHDFRLAPAELERLRALPCAKLLHSIGFAVGGSCAPDLAHVALLNRMADALASPWVSEHLSFNTARIEGAVTRTGMLMPPLQTPEGVAHAVGTARRYAAALNRPLALETGVNYLPLRACEMSDGRFVRQVVEEADCGILLDLHNLWTNERNGRQRALDFVAELPLERVFEIHVAGGEERSGYWIDSHCGPMPQAVRELAREVIPWLPALGAVTLEVFPAYLPRVGTDGLRREIDTLRDLLAIAPRPLVPPGPGTPAPGQGGAPGVADWEQSLAEAILLRPATTELGRALAREPALALYRELLGEFRASMVGTALGLTTRLLLIELGAAGMRELLSAFWLAVPPEMSAAAESIRFAEFLRARMPDVPLLPEILAFETAALRAVMQEAPQQVSLDCDIRLAIAALVDGKRPAHPGPTRFEFILDPPA
jgi:uncharacterized protein (UPF0276 family)